MNKNMLEIERKFLVKPSALNDATEGYELVQGYLTKNEYGSIRIRIETPLVRFPWWKEIFYFLYIIKLPKERAYLMSKTKVDDMSNNETVDEISVENAKTLINTFASKIIHKTRYIQYVDKKKWEIDVFESPNKGLILAEIELQDKFEEVYLPEWIEKEVTGDPNYYNANM